MATFLRPLSYRYQWLYDLISRAAALAVGGEARFRQLALQGLERRGRILDLCCGAGQTTEYLIDYGDEVIGLDISPTALQRARQKVPQARYVEGRAQDLPFADNSFDVVHTSSALHEMTPAELEAILQEVYRVLKPQGIFTLIDLHGPTNLFFLPGLNLFIWLFETETAWQFIQIDLGQLLEGAGFEVLKVELHAGGSLQVIQARKNP